MRFRKSIWALSLVLSFLLRADAEDERFDTQETDAKTSATNKQPFVAADTIQVLFKKKCASCHGPDMKGKKAMAALSNVPEKAMNLLKPETRKKTDVELETIVKNGKEKMPAFAKEISDEDIKQLVAYIREVGPKPAKK